MTTPGFTAEASLQDLSQGVSSLTRLHGEDGDVRAAAVGLPARPRPI